MAQALRKPVVAGRFYSSQPETLRKDIDELMAGANRMERRGWESNLGVGRHRISSALFYYVECPGGGAVEYGCDTDVVDDDWTPRVFEPSFGFLTWTGRVPPFLPQEAAWDMEYIGDADDFANAFDRP